MDRRDLFVTLVQAQSLVHVAQEVRRDDDVVLKNDDASVLLHLVGDAVDDGGSRAEVPLARDDLYRGETHRGGSHLAHFTDALFVALVP